MAEAAKNAQGASSAMPIMWSGGAARDAPLRRLGQPWRMGKPALAAVQKKA